MMFPIFLPMGSGGAGPAPSVKDWLKVGIVVGLAVWFMITMFTWLFPFESPGPTLLDVLKAQWHWIAGKRLW